MGPVIRKSDSPLARLPVSIVFDQDAKFTSNFWKGLQKTVGTHLKFSMVFHPQV